MFHLRGLLTLALAGAVVGGCEKRRSASSEARTNPGHAAAAPARPAEPAKPVKPAEPAKPAAPDRPVSSNKPAPTMTATDADVQRVAEWLGGEFDNLDQAKADAAYTDLLRHAVRIWPRRDDGPWVYVETTSAVAPEIVVHQHVVQVSRRADGAIVLTPHRFKGDPVEYVAAWKMPEPLVDLRPANLDVLTGCAIILWKSSESMYDGSTEGKACEAGADRFVIVEMEIGPDRIMRWERVLNPGYQLVQGPSKGGHVFKRLGK